MWQSRKAMWCRFYRWKPLQTLTPRRIGVPILSSLLMGGGEAGAGLLCGGGMPTDGLPPPVTSGRADGIDRDAKLPWMASHAVRPGRTLPLSRLV